MYFVNVVWWFPVNNSVLFGLVSLIKTSPVKKPQLVFNDKTPISPYRLRVEDVKADGAMGMNLAMEPELFQLKLMIKCMYICLYKYTIIILVISAKWIVSNSEFDRDPEFSCYAYSVSHPLIKEPNQVIQRDPTGFACGGDILRPRFGIVTKIQPIPAKLEGKLY